jgi:hypothetical protein
MVLSIIGWLPLWATFAKCCCFSEIFLDIYLSQIHTITSQIKLHRTALQCIKSGKTLHPGEIRTRDLLIFWSSTPRRQGPLQKRLPFDSGRDWIHNWTRHWAIISPDRKLVLTIMHRLTFLHWIIQPKHVRKCRRNFDLIYIFVSKLIEKIAAWNLIRH